jgi:hypothetical protein
LDSFVLLTEHEGEKEVRETPVSLWRKESENRGFPKSGSDSVVEDLGARDKQNRRKAVFFLFY